MAKEHHVAWADRLGLNKLWFEDMKMCSDTFGTDAYPNMVARFENDIININKGPQLKDEIKKYKNNMLDPMLNKQMKDWIDSHLQESQNPSFLRDKEIQLTKKRSELLYNHIIQLLENNGFGFYIGEYAGEYDKWE